MAEVLSHMDNERYKVEIKSPGGNTVIADEPVASGGQNQGFSPTELLCASLAACTSATLRMYADRKSWELDGVDTDISLTRDEAANKTSITRKIHLRGNLDETQRQRLLTIANSCPVHKILSNTIEVDTRMV